MSQPSTYKPSPLSFGSPRASPFRRPESPASPSTTLRQLTPTTSPTKPQTPSRTITRLEETTTPIASNDGSWTPRGFTPSIAQREPPVSPTKGAGAASAPSMTGKLGNKTIHVDAMAKLPPAQVREMREAFQILDRDSDGQVNREDVVEMLNSLGQDASPHSVNPFFASVQHTVSLPAYLSTLSTLLSPLSSQSELLSAFAAFDDDDSGQIDVLELRDALLHTSPELGGTALSEREVDSVVASFVGRRAFGKGIGSRAEVFRYGDFVSSVMGGTEEAGTKSGGPSVKA